MSFEIYLKEVSRGVYHNFRCYLNLGPDGAPVRYLDLSEELDFVNDKPTFLAHLFQALLETQVDVLDLSLNEIDDAGAKIIGEAIKSNKKMKRIYLGCNRIDRPGASELLRNITPEHNLEYLDLSFNEITDKSFDISSIIAFLKEEIVVVEAIKALLPLPITEPLLFNFIYISRKNYKNTIYSNSLLPDRESLNGSLTDSQKSNVVDYLSAKTSNLLSFERHKQTALVNVEGEEDISLQRPQESDDDTELEALTHRINKLKATK